MRRSQSKKRKIVWTAGVFGIAGLLGIGVLSGKTDPVCVDAGTVPADAAAVYENGWKSADADTEYVYCVASVSKVYSTAAVMQLVDEGRVGLDDPVTDYIPEFTMADPRYKDITVRMLMNHTSGLMGTSRPGMFLYDDADSYHPDHLLEILSGQRLKADPGAYASYCNDGFDLLGIITERVSGMSFTEYVQENIAAPSGGTTTGTGYTYAEFSALVPADTANYNRYDFGVTMAPGAGGVYATASDNAKFGAAFFKGNNILLSEGAKDEMAKIWNDTDPYMDDCGLGWDTVGEAKYDAAGVQVLGKGGDSGLNHAYLFVAPEEKISISVLSNGGSSMLNGLMAEAIMDACLEEQGIVIAEEPVTTPEIVSRIPESYDVYAGEYLVSGETGQTVDVISFPEHRYMHVESVGPYRTVCTDYVLTKDGRFASLAFEVSDSGMDEMKVSMNPQLVSFCEMENGQVLIAGERCGLYPGMGSHRSKSYAGEKMEENPLDEEVTENWQRYTKMDFCLANDIRSSANYDTAVTNTVLPGRFPGYVFVVNGMGTRLLKIVSDTEAIAFQTIPSSRNRDLIDVTIGKDGKNTILTSDGYEYVADADLPEFDLQTKEIPLITGRGVWYRIGSSAVHTEPVVAERPENSAIYVYNKFGEVVYSTHVADMTDILPMPEGGKILFLGEDGGTVTLK